MDKESTTGAGNDQGDQQNADNQPDSKATTDTQTGQQADNLDTSKSTEKPADGDKPADGGVDKDAPANQFDTDLDDWAEKRTGRKPETDEERTKLQDLRNEQREFTRSRQSEQSKKDASKLDSVIKDAKKDAEVKPADDDVVDPLEQRVKDTEARLAEERELRLRSEYFAEHSVTTDEAKAMSDILTERMERATTPAAKQKALDYLTDPENLEDWHALAKARLASAKGDTSAEDIEKAQREERERVAALQHATGPDRNASTTTTKDANDRHSQLLDRWSKPRAS